MFLRNLTRKVHSVSWFRGDVYRSRPHVKEYIEEEIKVYCMESGLDDQGAETAIVRSTAHRGGVDPAEANHVTITVLDGDGNKLPTAINGRETFGHHVYLDESETSK